MTASPTCRVLAFILTVAIAVLGASRPLAPAAAQPPPDLKRGGTMIVAMGSEPVGNFDPMRVADSGSSAVTTNIVEGLYKYDENLRPVPWLAESVERPDDVTYIFRLRRGVRFHDGAELDAEAVRFSVDRVRANPASPGYADGQNILESTVVDRYTYTIVLKEPYSPFPSLLTARLGAVVSPAAVREMGDEAFNRGPVGSGPFRSVVFQPSRLLRVERFDSYWRTGADGLPLPYLDRVEWRIISDGFDRLSALQRGTIQIGDIPIAAEPVARLDPRLTVASNPAGGSGYTGLLLTIDKPPFDNRALRQAVQLAIDRDELNDFWYDGGSGIAHGPIPPLFAWAVDPAFQPYGHDPARSREKLREGGMAEGFEFEVWAVQTERELIELIARQLSDVGIRMRIRLAPFATVVERVQRRESNAYSLGFTVGVDPDGAMSRFLPGNFFNYFPYDNPAATDLILRARRTSDFDVRGALYKEATALIMADLPIVFLFNTPNRFSGSARVRGWYLGVRATSGYAEFWLAD